MAVMLAGLAPPAWAQSRDPGVAPRGPSAPARPAAAPAPLGSTLGCVIEPAASAEVSAAAPGVLESVTVERGARVRRGQVIATLQSEVEQAAVEAARARASAESEVNALAATRDLAKLKLRRMHALAQLDFGGRLELENAAAEFEIADHRLQQSREALLVAQRDHELARRQLDQRQIRSPIDGVIADRLLNPGERVDGRPVVRVLAIDRLRAEVVVPASRFGRIREGMHASVKAEGLDAPEVSARVVQVDRFVDAASGTFRARLSMHNTDGAVPAGARCQVVFDDAVVPAVRPATAAPRARTPRAAVPGT
ncbi:MAG: efflux RND transporter periplasmic adaptor subunit [Burkholderiales bacterium]|nr:efflux RND transporter periplasmic adaptor subunit [Burkholderiales bacterium]MCZ8101636.1 efflux RND transporter periplasmic adaptor subunit [Burkholderiales bacterium]